MLGRCLWCHMWSSQQLTPRPWRGSLWHQRRQDLGQGRRPVSHERTQALGATSASPYYHLTCLDAEATTPSTFVDVMKTSRGWTSIWDRDTQPGQFSYQGGSLMWTSRQYEWGNGLQINQNSDGYVTSLMQERSRFVCHRSA